MNQGLAIEHRRCVPGCPFLDVLSTQLTAKQVVTVNLGRSEFGLLRQEWGMLTEMIWRYRRDRDVMYIRAEHQAPDHAYGLVWRHPNGTSRAVRVASLAMLYDHLRLLEEQLGVDGWELMPSEQRAPNRLPTPICEKCWPQRAIETARRSATHVHFRCTGCNATWVVAKPGVVASVAESAPHRSAD